MSKAKAEALALWLPPGIPLRERHRPPTHTRPPRRVMNAACIQEAFRHGAMTVTRHSQVCWGNKKAPPQGWEKQKENVDRLIL